ncbi:hypothetical protein ACTG0T_07205 [Halococcus morrhuae DSM 1307]|uniref:hypothetical protein n=1 Tax=Halococcus morrhuae TaxID=2250 RepID=UPI0012674330|nr:hypothetical protein [Halococcus morrhuae]
MPVFGSNIDPATAAIIAAFLGSLTTFGAGYIKQYLQRRRRKDRVRRSLLTEMKNMERLETMNEDKPDAITVENMGHLPSYSHFPTDAYESLISEIQLLTKEETEAVVDFYASLKDLIDVIDKTKNLMEHENTDPQEAVDRTAMAYGFLAGTQEKKETAEKILSDNLSGRQVKDSDGDSENGQD